MKLRSASRLLCPHIVNLAGMGSARHERGFSDVVFTDLQRMLDSGLAGFLHKPSTADEMIASLRAALAY